MPVAKKGERPRDPMPWLKLPKLDYVEVRGQEEAQGTGAERNLSPEDERSIVRELEGLQAKLRASLDAADMVEAERVKTQLERRMRESGFEFNIDK